VPVLRKSLTLRPARAAWNCSLSSEVGLQCRAGSDGPAAVDSPVGGGDSVVGMTTQTASSRPQPGPLARWAPLAVLMIGTFVFVLDFFIVNVALPTIQSGLHAGAAAVEWVVAGYGLSTAATLITGGRLGDRYGRRRIFAVGLALFIATSAGCALAPDGAALVAARLAQGVAAGLMAPNILSILGVAYTGTQRVRAISVYGMVMGVAATTGQLIGGVLVRADLAGLGWRSIFWINVPVGLAALAAIGRVPESRDERAGRLDLVGMVLVTAGLTSLILPLVDGRQHGWPAWSWACLGAAPVLLGGAAVHQFWLARRGGAPLINPGDLAGRGPIAGLLTQLVFWFQQAASYLFLALYLQQGRGQSALASGLVFTVLAAGYLATSWYAPALTARFGRQVIMVGSLVAAVGDVALAIAVHHGAAGSILLLLPGLFLIGAGQGLCITPLISTVLAYASPATAGTISGALSTMQQVGNALGVAVIGVVFFGTLSRGYGAAFDASLLLMAVLLVLVAALTRLLPRPGRP
jgi:MFS family permease